MNPACRTNQRCSSLGKLVALFVALALAASAFGLANAPQAQAAKSVSSVKITNIVSGKSFVSCKYALRVGNAKTLQVKVVAKKGVSKKVGFKSSNNSIATVTSSGKIVAKKTGTCTITVYSKVRSSVKATLRLTVKKRESQPQLPDYDATGSFTTSSSSAVLASESGNSCYSPLSAYMALSMLGVGVNDTENAASNSQLLAALNATDSDTLKEECHKLLMSLNHEPASTSSSTGKFSIGSGSSGSNPAEVSTLRIANSIWCGNGYSFTPEYQAAIKNYFDGTSQSINFLTESGKITQWISNKTDGLLKPTFDFDEDTIAALVNTVYFKDNWSLKFSEETVTDTFTCADGSTVQADYLADQRHSSYGEGENYTCASLYFSAGSKMTFYLPDEGTTANELVSTPEKVAALLNTSTSTQTVSWKLPKFSFDAEYDLADAVKSLGIKDALDKNVWYDFENMLVPDASMQDTDPFVASVVQGTHIGLDYDGVEAAAYTVVGTSAAGAAPTQPVDFTLDHPFVYTITAENGTVLFIGVVQNPTAK